MRNFKYVMFGFVLMKADSAVSHGLKAGVLASRCLVNNVIGTSPLNKGKIRSEHPLDFLFDGL